MSILIAAILGGIVYFGIALLLDRSLARGKGAESVLGSSAAEELIAVLDSAIERALSYVDSLVPLSELTIQEGRLAELRNSLNEERQKIETLDKRVVELQGTIEREELSHSELKKGKEVAVSHADKIRADTDKLTAEHSRLEMELEQSLSHLDRLSSELQLTLEQEQAVANLSESLIKARSHMQSLKDIHTQGVTRFVNLEAQFAELEREYTKLVEKELNEGGV